MFQMLGVFAEFERGIIRERGQRRSGSGEGEWDKARPTSGYPTVETRILELKASGHGILKIGRKLGIGTSVVQRVFKQERVPS